MSMSVGDVARLLAMCAAIDKRTIGDTDAWGWHAVIGHLDYHACREAVAVHYRESTKPAMPADIRRLAKTTTTATGYVCPQCLAVHGSDPCDVVRPMPEWFRPTFAAFLAGQRDRAAELTAPTLRPVPAGTYATERSEQAQGGTETGETKDHG